jgi:hypothetical protein
MRTPNPLHYSSTYSCHHPLDQGPYPEQQTESLCLHCTNTHNTCQPRLPCFTVPAGQAHVLGIFESSNRWRMSLAVIIIVSCKCRPLFTINESLICLHTRLSFTRPQGSTFLKPVHPASLGHRGFAPPGVVWFQGQSDPCCPPPHPLSARFLVRTVRSQVPPPMSCLKLRFGPHSTPLKETQPRIAHARWHF